jgi:hypothetical protein
MFLSENRTETGLWGFGQTKTEPGVLEGVSGPLVCADAEALQHGPCCVRLPVLKKSLSESVQEVVYACVPN